MSKRITETDSLYNNLEKMNSDELLRNINSEDKKVASAVESCIPEITEFVNDTYLRMKKGGRLFYLGAGTSGRLGVVDASECPPTFGVSHDVVKGIIAGGDSAIRRAVENAEDDANQGWQDLLKENFTELDTLVGIAASGTTPYVLGAIKAAKKLGAITCGLTNNPKSPLSNLPKHKIVPVVGPEFVTGSTRMKSGTSQKLVLNMISTSLMVLLGKVRGNKMVDMQLSNKKLVQRGIDMIMHTTGMDEKKASELLSKYGNVRDAIDGAI
ncbi:MAG: N-acetylmuramic acid 6-phosphate etherase [Crocinitomicaceae bacterium]